MVERIWEMKIKPYREWRSDAPNEALKPTRFRYAPAVGLALRWAS